MSFGKQIETNGADEVVFVDNVVTADRSAPEDELCLSGDEDDCGDSSSGTSVCGYDADYDNEDNDTVCYDDTTVELTTGAERSHLPNRGFPTAVIDSNNNPINDRCLKKWIFIGSTVLSRWTDGLFYLGLIVQIDANATKCLIQFEDSSLYWIRFEDLHKQLSTGSVMADSDILCVVCRDGASEAPNEIVICDVCNQGYHQKCHKPRIGDEILEPDIPWTCRLCVFALGTKEGGAEKTGVIGRALKQMKTELTYDLSALHWDDSHQTNQEQRYCYCGGNGNYYSKMLRCSSCMQWFHEACIQSLETPLLYGDHYYAFKCSVCSKGREYLKRIAIKWSDMLGLVINNLALQHQKQFFDLSTDIVPFVQNYSNMFLMSEDITKLSERELQARVLAVFKTNQIRFVNGREVRKKAGFWALRVPFPFETPLIFAPPFAIHSPSQSSSPPVPLNNPNTSETQTKSLPPSIPLIYGACRKGASKWPLTVSAFNQNNNKNIQSNGRSNSCSSSTGSNSCNASTLSFSSRSTRVSKKSNKLKTNRTNTEKTATKRKATNHSTKSSDLNSDMSSDTEVISAPPIESLEAVIPVPKNFEGDNNPFAETEPNVLRRCLSNSPISPRTRLATGLAQNKRISGKAEPNGSTDSRNSKDIRPKMECFVDSPEKSSRNDNTFNILAQRVNTNGKVEYLLEWTTN